MSVFRHTLVVLLVIIAGAVSCYAQKATGAHIINSTFGLSNNQINDIYQDSRGYLWFATDDGLNRFDGYEYVIFRPEIYDSSSISSGLIRTVTSDKAGVIWVATYKGLSRYNSTSNSFTNITFYPPSPGGSENQIVDITFSNDTTLWCLMSTSLIVYNTSSNTFLEYPLCEKSITSRGFTRNTVYYDHFHDILIIGTRTGLYYLNSEREEIAPLCLEGISVNTFFQDNRGNLWVGTANGLSICKWKNGDRLPFVCELALGDENVVGIGQSGNERLVLATRDKVILFDVFSKTAISDTYVSLANNEQIPVILSLLIDKSMNLWLGTRGGVCHAYLNDPLFLNYQAGTGDVILNHNSVSSIYSSGKMQYFGSWNGGLDIVDLESGKSTFYSRETPDTFFPDRGVNSIFCDSKNRLWVFSDKMYQFIRQTKKFITAESVIKIPGVEQIRGSRVMEMVEIESQVLAIAHYSGVYLIDEINESFRNITSVQIDTFKLELANISSIEADGNGFWIGMAAGIVYYSMDDIGHDFFPVDGDNGLADQVIALKRDSKGQLWVGTPSGLYRFVRENRFFFGFSVQSGLANDFIYSIEEDRSGKLWLGTNKGIISLNPDNNEVRNYGVQHGLSCMEFNLHASFFTEEGKMLFGGVKGVNFFYPDSLKLDGKIPQIELTGMRHFCSDGQYYKPFIPRNYSIRDNEAIQIFFSLMDFGDPKYKIFKYRVSSSNEKGIWNLIGNENSIILAGLTHGKYSIEVLGSASDGQWSMIPAELHLSVVAPFYRQRIFLWIMLLPIVALIFFLFEYRTKTLRKSNRALREKEITAREVLRQKNLLSYRNKGIEDSLKYAQRIQYAMFTSESEIRKMFPESFILQKPKDIVSGDFYWAKKIGSKVFIAAADCTGHGVPGAFMSLIGLEFFRQIIGVQGIYQPSLVLDEINRNFDLIFANEDDLNLRDGMDLSLCAIDTSTNTLEFSGAFSPLYIIRDGEIVEIKADKIMLGPDLGFGRKSFTNSVFELQKDDILYMFSDGYADQFGGPEGKKFKFRRFRHLLLSIYDQPMVVQQNILENSITDWQGNYEQVDDILVLGFRPVVSI